MSPALYFDPFNSSCELPTRFSRTRCLSGRSLLSQMILQLVAWSFAHPTGPIHFIACRQKYATVYSSIHGSHTQSYGRGLRVCTSYSTSLVPYRNTRSPPSAFRNGFWSARCSSMRVEPLYQEWPVSQSVLGSPIQTSLGTIQASWW